jgi:hypothetical protein
MDWLLVALLSAFVIVTIILCVVCSRSAEEKPRERLDAYHPDGYEFEPTEVPQFEPEWRTEGSENLPPRKQHQYPKDGSRT